MLLWYQLLFASFKIWSSLKEKIVYCLVCCLAPWPKGEINESEKVFTVEMFSPSRGKWCNSRRNLKVVMWGYEFDFSAQLPAKHMGECNGSQQDGGLCSHSSPESIIVGFPCGGLPYFETNQFPYPSSYQFLPVGDFYEKLFYGLIVTALQNLHENITCTE